MNKLVIGLMLVNSCYALNSVTDLNFAKSAKNKFGTLYINESDVDGDIMFLNKNKIDLSKEGNDFSLALLNEFVINNSYTYLVWGGSGGTMDMDTNKQCKFINITSPSKYTVSSLTYCPLITKDGLSIESNLIKVKYANIMPYAESNDIGILNYNPGTNKIQVVKDTKSNLYYKHKFANLTPKQIYDEALSDGNFDNDTGLLRDCHMCGMYGQKYCFKFQSLKNPVHDKYYTILQKSCN